MARPGAPGPAAEGARAQGGAAPPACCDHTGILLKIGGSERVYSALVPALGGETVFQQQHDAMLNFSRVPVPGPKKPSQAPYLLSWFLFFITRNIVFLLPGHCQMPFSVHRDDRVIFLLSSIDTVSYTDGHLKSNRRCISEVKPAWSRGLALLVYCRGGFASTLREGLCIRVNETRPRAVLCPRLDLI